MLRPDLVIDLAAGAEKPIEMADAQAIALDTARRLGASTVLAADEIEEDQWTLGRYRADQPLFRFAFDDPQRSTLYVSRANGRVVLRTSGTQRFWNWLGAIPHWFYFTALRSDGALWSRTVIWPRCSARCSRPSGFVSALPNWAAADGCRLIAACSTGTTLRASPWALPASPLSRAGLSR
jgi:hypothetical protein